MFSPKLLQFLLCLLVVVTVFSVAVKHVFDDGTKWQEVTATGLAFKMKQDLAQMYWQWQQEGRPPYIVYQPEHAQSAMKIKMQANGLPMLTKQEGTCKQVLAWFVEDAVIDVFIQVEPLTGEKSAKNEGMDCQFTIAKQDIFYRFEDATILQRGN